jgi:hypothetical protein
MGRGRQSLRGIGRLGAACVGAGVVLAAMLAPVGVGFGVLSNQVNDSVSAIGAGADDGQLTAAQVPLTTTVLDRTGAPIASLYDQYRLPVTYDGIAQTMRAAIVDIEDRRFFSESGVDPRAVLRAAVNNSSGGSTQGASTITQQYVKNYLINVIDRTDPAAQRADRADTISARSARPSSRSSWGTACRRSRSSRATSTSSSSPAASTAWPRPRTPTSARRPTSSPCRRPRCWPGW